MTGWAGLPAIYQAEWLAVMRGKLGLLGEDAGDLALAEGFLAALAGVDWTLAFRRLAAAEGDDVPLRALFADLARLDAWLPRWRARLSAGAAELLAANPAVIPRNHLVEAALEAATAGDMAPFEALLAAGAATLRAGAGPRRPLRCPRPKGLAPYVTYCGT